MLDFSEALMIHMIYNSIQDMKYHDKKQYKNVSLSFMVPLRLWAIREAPLAPIASAETTFGS